MSSRAKSKKSSSPDLPLASASRMGASYKGLFLIACSKIVGFEVSPVTENSAAFVELSPSSSGPVESAVNLPGPPGKPEYFSVTDSG